MRACRAGACAAAITVGYVVAGALNTECTQAKPCGSIAGARGQGFTVIRVTGHLAEFVLVSSSALTIIGDRDSNGAVTSGLTTSAIGTLVTVNGTGNVTLVDMNLDGGTIGTNGVVNTSSGTVELDHCTLQRMTDYGVYSTAGTLHVHRSTIAANKKAGIDLFATSFAIDNSFVVKNGDIASTALGGISLSQSPGTLVFSTIANNFGNTSGSKGVTCDATVNAFTSNVVYGNTNGQVSGACTWTYSDFDTATGSTPSGTGNMTVDPAFVDGNNGNFHLMPTSTLRDMADPSSTLPIDIDGNARPQGNARDIGADELMP